MGRPYVINHPPRIVRDFLFVSSEDDHMFFFLQKKKFAKPMFILFIYCLLLKKKKFTMEKSDGQRLAVSVAQSFRPTIHLLYE